MDKVVIFTDEEKANLFLSDNVNDITVLKIDISSTEHHPVIGIWYKDIK